MVKCCSPSGAAAQWVDTELLSASALLDAVVVYSLKLQQHAHAAHQKKAELSPVREKGRKTKKYLNFAHIKYYFNLKKIALK